MAKKNEILDVQDLESTNQVATTGRLSKSNNTVNFASREWLEANNPEDYQGGEYSSPKFEANREERVLNGLSLIESFIKAEVIEINPLIILLGKWWEIKPARAEIKKMIDSEAISKDIDANDYLQNVLSDEVDTLKNVQTAVDRLRYAVTYFKPRVAKAKVVMKNLPIDGVYYQVPENVLVELKEKYGKDTKKIAAKIKETCSILEIEEL